MSRNRNTHGYLYDDSGLCTCDLKTHAEVERGLLYKPHTTIFESMGAIGGLDRLSEYIYNRALIIL